MVAIYLNPEAFDTSQQALMGRHSAGEGFLQGYLRYTRADRLHFWNVVNERQDKLDAFVEKFDLGDRSVHWIARGDNAGLSQAGIVQLPSPRIAEFAWVRRPSGETRYGVVGVTHTTASLRIMEAMAATLTAPVQPWDAIICTSRAVRASVAAQLDAAADHLRAHVGARLIRPPRLATIPLGIDTKNFDHDPEQRRAWREQLDIPADAIVVLYVGRFSLTSKMNPVPMAMALERAAKETGREIYWVLSGWAGGEKNEQRFHDYTRAHCPSVHYKVVDGRKPENRYSIWSVGDIFISLSDNVQETFGLTPVEAMAAGLPSVISDWDGYKDTVRHDIDGFRITTYAPRPGRGLDLATRLYAVWDSYDAYVGQTAQFVAIDLDEATSALIDLINNPGLRRQMGRSAQQRARDTFDWKHIIPQYEDLWDELDSIRRKAPAPALQRNSSENPVALDPFRLFAAYPTELVSGHTLISLAPGLTEESATAMLALPMVSAGAPVLPTGAETRRVIATLAQGGQHRVADLIRLFPINRRSIIERGLVWLAKYGLAKITGRSSAIPE